MCFNHTTSGNVKLCATICYTRYARKLRRYGTFIEFDTDEHLDRNYLLEESRKLKVDRI